MVEDYGFEYRNDRNSHFFERKTRKVSRNHWCYWTPPCFFMHETFVVPRARRSGIFQHVPRFVLKYARRGASDVCHVAVNFQNGEILQLIADVCTHFPSHFVGVCGGPRRWRSPRVILLISVLLTHSESFNQPSILAVFHVYLLECHWIRLIYLCLFILAFVHQMVADIQPVRWLIARRF